MGAEGGAPSVLLKKPSSKSASPSYPQPVILYCGTGFTDYRARSLTSKTMKATEIWGSKSSPCNNSQQGYKRALAAVLPDTAMCLPMLETRMIRIDIKDRKKQSSGGYEPVAALRDASEYVHDVGSETMSYHDFIHFNYGAASQRYYTSPDNPERE